MESGKVAAAFYAAPVQTSPPERLAAMLMPGGTLADIKAMWRGQALPLSLDYWTL